MSHRPDPSSEANSSCCHRSDAWSHLEYRVVLSAYIAMLQMTSSGRWLIYSRKSVGQRMEHWGTPALTGYSCEDLPSPSRGQWIPNPGVQCSKPLGGSKVNSAFHLSEVDKVSTRKFWGLSGKM